MNKISIIFIVFAIILSACNNTSDKKRCAECFKEFEEDLKELDKKTDSEDIDDLYIKQQQCANYYEDAKNEFDEDELKEFTKKMQDSEEVIELIRNYN